MGWTFTRERRGSNYYLYRQKIIDGEHKHVPVGAKDWKDLHNKLWDKAQQEVYGENWVGYGLTPSEKETYNWILEDVKSTRMSDRSPIVERYRKQLGMKYNRKNRSSTIDPRLTSQKEKNILKAARKAFLKGVMIASIKREEC